MWLLQNQPAESFPEACSLMFFVHPGPLPSSKDRFIFNSSWILAFTLLLRFATRFLLVFMNSYIFLWSNHHETNSLGRYLLILLGFKFWPIHIEHTELCRVKPTVGSRRLDNGQFIERSVRVANGTSCTQSVAFETIKCVSPRPVLSTKDQG